MKERPILFSAPMVRAILEGRKTMTRRALKKQPPFLARVRHTWFNAPIYGFTDEDVPAANWWKIRCPYGQPGDRLWVRETWRKDIYDNSTHYRASHPCPDLPKWKPAIHMFRKDSRINLEITAVRVEQLQDITEDDAKAEGAQCGVGCPDHRIAFGRLWESINGPGSWSKNPWVWVVEFKLI